MKDGKMETFVPMTLRRRGVQRLVQQPVVDQREAHDSTLIEGMGRAFHSRAG